MILNKRLDNLKDLDGVKTSNVLTSVLEKLFARHD